MLYLGERFMIMSKTGKRSKTETAGHHCVPAGIALLILSIFIVAQGDERGIAIFFIGGIVLGIGCALRAGRWIK